MPPTAPSDPATAAVDPPVIRGEVLRLYQVRTIDDVDYYLRGLKTWLIASIDRSPKHAMDYIERYNVDLDRLLDERLRLMELGG